MVAMALAANVAFFVAVRFTQGAGVAGMGVAASGAAAAAGASAPHVGPLSGQVGMGVAASSGATSGGAAAAAAAAAGTSSMDSSETLILPLLRTAGLNVPNPRPRRPAGPVTKVLAALALAGFIRAALRALRTGGAGLTRRADKAVTWFIRRERTIRMNDDEGRQ